MVKIKRVRTLALPSTNPQATERFLTEVLGGQVQNRIQHPGQGGTVDEVFVELGNVRVALASLNGGATAPSGFPHFTLEVEGHVAEQQLRGELEAAGISVETVRPHGEGGGYSCYVRDPDGNRFELWVGD